MPQINLQLLIGSAAGRHSSFDQDLITFGRAEQSDLSVAESFVSRRHGEIRFENDQWMLYNLSSNGTVLNRKKITTRPQPLKAGDTITVGDRPVIRVGFDLEPSVQPAISPTADPTSSSPLSGRTKLWIGLSLYVLVMFAGILAVRLVLNRSEKATASGPPEWTAAQIENDIIRPRSNPLDQARADQALHQATQLYFQREVNPVNIYHCFAAYQESLAFSGKEDFDNPTDILRFREVQAQLVERITGKYQAAVATLLSGQYRKADQAFDKLIELYPNQASNLYENMQLHRRSAQLNLAKRRRPKGTGFKRR